MSVATIAAMRKARLRTWFATAMHGTAMAAATDPMRMKGVRLPIAERQWSLMMPNQGSRNRPKMLSSAMTTPVTVWESPNVPTRISGTRPSKTCQKEIIPMKGSAAKAMVFAWKG